MPEMSAVVSTPSAPSPAVEPEPAQARYRVTFQSDWSASTHPVDYPSSAHFSPLVGATHSDRVGFWREGALATLGIQDVAERGLTFRLGDEMNGAVAGGTAERWFTGPALGSTPGTTSLEFDITQAFPLLTLVTMVAPSPDWFTGVSGLRLFDGQRWVQEVVVTLTPWDAGTDSGTTFLSADLPSVPHVPVASISTAPLAPGGRVVPLGRFTFTRLQ